MARTRIILEPHHLGLKIEKILWKSLSDLREPGESVSDVVRKILIIHVDKKFKNKIK